MLDLMDLCKQNISYYCRDIDLPLAVIYEQSQADLHLHSHDFSELILILNGSGVFFNETDKTNLRPGCVLVAPPGVWHGYEQTSELSVYSVLFKMDSLPLIVHDLADISGFHSLFPSGPHINKPKQIMGPEYLYETEFQSILRKIRELEDYLANTSAGWKITAITSFYSFMITLCKAIDNQTVSEYFPIKSVNKVVRYMEINYMKPLQLKDLIDVAYMSESSLQRSFKQIFGSSPMQVLSNIRLRKSRELLKNTNLPISKIAAFCGFYDSSHLCRKFQANYKESPERYRKQTLMA